MNGLTAARLALLAAAGLLLGAGALTRAGSVQTPAGSRAGQAADGSAAPDFGLGLSGVVTPTGIRVTAVEGQKPAAQMGIEPGDMILAVNRYAVRSLRDWIDVMSDGDGLLYLRLRDVRTGSTVYRQVDLRH